MTKKKIIIIAIAVVLALFFVAVCVETSLNNAETELIGVWDCENSGAITELKLTIDGETKEPVAEKQVNGVTVEKGTWDFSWYKVTIKLPVSGEQILKIKNQTLTGENVSYIKTHDIYGGNLYDVNEKLQPVTQVKFYRNGFFGFSEKGSFKYWSFAHFFPIALYGLAIYFIFRYRKQLKNWKHEENVRFIMAATMLFAEISYFWRLLYVGSSEVYVTDMMDKLPLQVCEWTCIFAAFMLMKKSKMLYPICFYVCLTIGIFPILTPSVITTTGPTYWRYYQYWLEHLLPPLAVFYMTFVHGFRPTKKGILGGVGYMATLVVFALICNNTFEEANYLYIKKGTADGGGSLMDPIYNLVGGSTVLLLLLLTVLIIGIFFAAYYINIGLQKWHASYLAKKNAKESTEPEEIKA